MKADIILVLAELMMVCHDQLKNKNVKPRNVKESDMAGTIYDHLDVLVAQEQLSTLEAGLKSKYKMIFELILHADELSQDIVAEIHIKNAEKTIKSSSYPSPQKYKEA